jgi:hypothetical protein
MSSSHVAIDRHLTTGSISYHITAAGDDEQPIELVIAGRDQDGQVVTSLTGEIRPADLPAVTDLVSSTLAGLVAVRSPGAPAARRRPGKHGIRWTPEDDERLLTRFREGINEKDLMAEFDRTRGGIRSRLEHLGEIQPPAAPADRTPQKVQS